MTQYKSDRNKHIIIGLIVLGILYYLNMTYKWVEAPADFQSLSFLLGVGIVYSLLSDVDQPGSTINRYVTLGLVGVIIYSFYNVEHQKYGIWSALLLGVLRIVGHRTIVHSVLGGVILSLPLLYLGKVYFIVGLVAFISHIIADNDFSLGWEKDTRLW